MSRSARQGRKDGHRGRDHPLSTSSKQPSRDEDETYSEDEERAREMSKRLLEDIEGITAFQGLFVAVLSVSLRMSAPYLRPDIANPNVTHTPTPSGLRAPIAEPPSLSLPTYARLIQHRLFSLAMTLISALFVGLSLRWKLERPTRPVRPDAWYQVTLCLYFVALVKLLFDVDFGLLIYVIWWIGFLPVTWHHLERSRAMARTVRQLLFIY